MFEQLDLQESIKEPDGQHTIMLQIVPCYFHSPRRLSDGKTHDRGKSKTFYMLQGHRRYTTKCDGNTDWNHNDADRFL